MAKPGLAAEAPAVEITAEPAHHLALENEWVRVFQVEVAAHASTLLHSHQHDYMSVTLGDSHVSNEVQGKTPVELSLADGEARFTPGGFAHVAKNLADRPFRNVAVELMQDGGKELKNGFGDLDDVESSLRWTPKTFEPAADLKEVASTLLDQPSPPEAEGNREFPGVRIKELFIRDGARISQVEIQPGATVPRHHHDGPHLVVALNDLELRSELEGRGPVTGKLKAGDVRWLPGGLTHSLTNAGESSARLVTVEFKPAAGVSTSP